MTLTSMQRELGLRLRASGCTGGFANSMPNATTNAFDAEARVVVGAGAALDLRRVWPLQPDVRQTLLIWGLSSRSCQLWRLPTSARP
jgi:hypothetical protein